MALLLRLKDFTNAPSGRFISEGGFSGEQFRNDILEPAFLRAKTEGTTLHVNVDCIGYPSSFFNEAFGGLARMHNTPLETLWDTIILESERGDADEIISDVKRYATDEFLRCNIMSGQC